MTSFVEMDEKKRMFEKQERVFCVIILLFISVLCCSYRLVNF